MKKLQKSFILMFTLVIAVSLIFTACNSQNSKDNGSGTTASDNIGTDSATSTGTGANTGTKSSLKGNILIAGSTSVEPLARELAEAFMDKNPDVQIDIQGGGSTAGVQAAIEKTADIGNSSRNLKEEEKSAGLTETTIALDGVAVVINPANTVTDLKKEDIVKIYKKEITNWKELGGPDKEIVVISREAGSGTKDCFDSALGLKEEEVKADIIANGTGVVQANVSGNEAAIGYMSLGSVDETVKKVAVDGVEANAENVKNGTYSISRPFLMLTNGQMKDVVKAFIDFILSDEGQDIVSKEFISVK